MVFRGRSQRSLDPKGRLMVPADFRDIVLDRSAEGKFVLTCYDGCLVGFPLPDWEEFERQVQLIRNPSRKLRDFRRLVIGSAEMQELDKQGRILLSPAQRDYAGLEKDVVLVGQLQKFEIWNPERLSGIDAQNYDDVADEFGDIEVCLPL